MPIYEFCCDSCGERFEALVDAGTESLACPACDSAETCRVFSAQAAPMSLVKPARERREQERRNAQLRERTKASVRQSRRRARDAPKRGSGG